MTLASRAALPLSLGGQLFNRLVVPVVRQRLRVLAERAHGPDALDALARERALQERGIGLSDAALRTFAPFVKPPACAHDRFTIPVQHRTRSWAMPAMLTLPPTAQSLATTATAAASAASAASNRPLHPWLSAHLTAPSASSSATPRRRVLVYLHGGAFVMCSIRQYHQLGVFARLASLTGSPVLAIDYSLSPDFRYPTALHDTLATIDWLTQPTAATAAAPHATATATATTGASASGSGGGYRASDIVLVGDSAGGNLALTALLALRNSGRELPRGAVTLSPWTDLGAAYDSRVSDALLPVQMAKVVSEWYGGAGQSLTDPLVSPARASVEQLRGLPPVLLQFGEREALLATAQPFVERARAAGVNVQLDVWPAMCHCFQLAASVVPEARHAWQHAADWIARL